MRVDIMSTDRARAAHLIGSFRACHYRPTSKRRPLRLHIGTCFSSRNLSLQQLINSSIRRFSRLYRPNTV